MKFRSGFVSNSSSSSFVIRMRDLTGSQIDAIMNHIRYANEYSEDNQNDYVDFGYASEDDAWCVWIEDGCLRGSTSMNNFSMYSLFEHLGIPDDKVTWSEY